ncbi:MULTISPECIES: GAF domain-containing protein [Clostridium]|uniref:GAF domain-containing protein n=1 Tax=Clostridium cadaveris TaxID=1529 RepID=A0A1I2J174_9CLOT|nr:GAF domain-containing protein [Clostridium cadaveris]MDU4953746.1 GAF domain-containing protein [Clostridium sp.]MDM8311376.1 GAF domain-containing protein [Clostridium cadaveris]MDY4950528.1 GAF domain-containing protein [Clostridium cadaveris]NME63284.1 GAF domain-containing protein [Clostridium cadaveris]UFH63570.1 GAF domain-containing protein [Clostridium cadaveris]
MIKVDFIKNLSKEDRLKYMVIMAEGQLSSENDFIANLSNISAIINVAVDDCNWVGFYIMQDETLVLGPFQGLPACNRIELGKGVCGTAAFKKQVMRIENVHEFKGHIACDNASNSEIVIPIVKDDKVIGVLDMDSPSFSRFSELEEMYLVKLVKKIENYI